MSDSDTRVSVIVGVRQRDPERWREFDSIYRPILFAYLSKRGLKEFEANDVIQDVFVKLLSNIHTYDQASGKFRSWLFSLAHNTLIDHARRHANYKKALDGWAERVLRATATESLKMAEEWVKIHREKVLEHALARVRERISSRAWTCFEQRMLRNRPANQVAAELKLAPNVVYVYASRVLKQVRALCEAFDEDFSHAFDSGTTGNP
jgi:RNA polymerase sigma-70 factor (ECF subfamily)